jgi:hypothetical protein
MIGAAFVFEKITEFAKEIADAALQTKNMAAAAGLSAPDMRELQDVMVAVGGSADSMARTLERLGRNMVTAIGAPTGTQARAFQALGVSMVELEHQCARKLARSSRRKSGPGKV